MSRSLSSLEPSLKRMATEIGIDRVGKDASSRLLEYLDEYTTDLCDKINIYVEHTRSKTVKSHHVAYIYPGVAKLAGAYIMLTKAVMERLIRSKIGPYRLSLNGLQDIIYVVQERLVKVITAAGTIMHHAHRKTLNEADIDIAITTMQECID